MGARSRVSGSEQEGPSQEGTRSKELEPAEQGEGASTYRHLGQEATSDCDGCLLVMEKTVPVCGKCTLKYLGRMFELESKHVRTKCQQFAFRWFHGTK